MADEQGLLDCLQDRDIRARALVQICAERRTAYLPLVEEVLSDLTWAEVREVAPVIHQLGTAAVPMLVALLESSRKQTFEIATAGLGALQATEAAARLALAMQEQVGKANALRARDALISIGASATGPLLEALDSRSWEVRYHAVQALGAVGRPDSLERLLEVSESDRSDKVREAATEALHFVAAMERTEMSRTYDGFYNPALPYGYGPGWRVDVLNGDYASTALHWDQESLWAGTADVDSKDVVAKAILKPLPAIVEDIQSLDLVVSFVAERRSDGGEDFIAVLTQSIRVEDQPAAAFGDAVMAALTQLPGYRGTAKTRLMAHGPTPWLRIDHGAMVQYDVDGSYEPEGGRVDTAAWFGTGRTFRFRKAVIDTGWSYRRVANQLRDKGHFKHVLPNVGAYGTLEGR